MFCPMPFQSFQVKPSGDVHCCCEDWLPIRLGNILEESAAAIWRGGAATEIRRSILDGSFGHCVRCPFLPGPRGPVTGGPLEPPLPAKIRDLWLDYDRTCNLACPSCRSGYIWRSPRDAQTSRVHEAVLSSGLLSQIRRLHVSGAGDPFASSFYWGLLRSLAGLPHNPDLEIALMTNGQLLDEQHWEELGLVREQVAEIGISIDAATEEVYAANRGGSWRRLWHNIDFARELRRQGARFALAAYFVVQANNFRELPLLRAMTIDEGFDRLHVFCLRNWGTFSDEDYRERAVHLPGHFEHGHFLRAMADPVLADPRIELPFLPPFAESRLT
jgi:radical SAM protein with 4Fe4S-binding SPASM domain